MTYTHTSRSLPILSDYVARAKAEVREDIASGRVPADAVQTFGDLHNYVDANDYGGITDDGFPARFPTDDAWMEFCTQLQDAVDAWLVAGGHLPGQHVLDYTRLQALALEWMVEAQTADPARQRTLRVCAERLRVILDA